MLAGEMYLSSFSAKKYHLTRTGGLLSRPRPVPGKQVQPLSTLHEQTSCQKPPFPRNNELTRLNVFLPHWFPPLKVLTRQNSSPIFGKTAGSERNFQQQPNIPMGRGAYPVWTGTCSVGRRYLSRVKAYLPRRKGYLARGKTLLTPWGDVTYPV